MNAVEIAQESWIGKFHQVERLWGVTILEVRRGFRWDLEWTFLRPVTHCHESSGTLSTVRWTLLAPSVSLKHNLLVSLKHWDTI